jgi:hypothetical protein
VIVSASERPNGYTVLYQFPTGRHVLHNGRSYFRLTMPKLQQSRIQARSRLKFRSQLIDAIEEILYQKLQNFSIENDEMIKPKLFNSKNICTVLKLYAIEPNMLERSYSICHNRSSDLTLNQLSTYSCLKHFSEIDDSKPGDRQLECRSLLALMN